MLCPLETCLLSRGPEIHYVLLEECSCPEDVVGFMLTWVKTKGSIFYEGDCGALAPGLSSHLPISMIICSIHPERHLVMPARFTIGEEEDIMEWVVQWAELTDALEATLFLSEDDIPWIAAHITIPRQDEGQLILGNRQVVASTVCGRIKVEGDLLTLIGRDIVGQLQSLLIPVCELVMTVEDIM